MNPISPSITVVIPTYNRGAAIYKTIESALHQDLPADEFEIIVVDDGSTDDTFAVLEAAYAHNPRVRLFSTPNGGVARARNFGLEQARGEFIAYLDHDDLWLPQKLRLQREAMGSSPEIGVVCCDWLAVNESGEVLPKPRQFQAENGWIAPPKKAYPWVFGAYPKLPLLNPIVSMSVPLIRTELLRKIGGFDETTVPSDDWDIWIRLSAVTQFAYCADIGAHYVFHGNQQHTNALPALDSWLIILEKHRVSKADDFALWRRQKAYGRFVKQMRHHIMAKEFLFSHQYLNLVVRLGAQIFLSPKSAFSRQNIYLLYRAATFNCKRY